MNAVYPTRRLSDRLWVFGVIEQINIGGNGPVVDQEKYQHVYMLTDGLVGNQANFYRSELSGDRIAIVFIGGRMVYKFNTIQ